MTQAGARHHDRDTRYAPFEETGAASSCFFITKTFLWTRRNSSFLALPFPAHMQLPEEGKEVRK